MKILLDVTAVSQPLSGIGRYALELAQHLPACPGVEEVLYLVGDRVQGRFDPAAGAAPPSGGQFRQWLKPLLPYKLLLGPYRARRARALAASLHDYREYFYHSPNFSLPPVASAAVVTLHDLSVFHFPQFHPRDRVNYLRDQIAHSIERADRLVTDSAFVRAELLRLFDLPAARVTAVPLGVDAAFRPRPVAQLQTALAPYGLHAGAYLLSVGTIEPRKNLAGLLRAHGQLDPALRRRYPLVIAGAYGWNSAPLLEDIERLRRTGELVYLDYVPEQDLPALYAGAAAFCYFSFYEGFGLPVLEAMASGVPVICAEGSALDELCAGVAAQANPRDDMAMHRALQGALEDEPWRREAGERGRARAAEFTWQRSARELVQVFAELAA
ncbi:MAG: glycosyltransferase family 4 protein [Halieaceae bacterium]|nr:glycosyltransferase family 4 protein [Halieaceae bacterium]MCP5204719.1 glycosyltransferase family 4 protein [Pseudomonadales bacterium]